MWKKLLILLTLVMFFNDVLYASNSKNTMDYNKLYKNICNTKLNADITVNYESNAKGYTIKKRYQYDKKNDVAMVYEGKNTICINSYSSKYKIYSKEGTGNYTEITNVSECSAILKEVRNALIMFMAEDNPFSKNLKSNVKLKKIIFTKNSSGYAGDGWFQVPNSMQDYFYTVHVDNKYRIDKFKCSISGIYADINASYNDVSLKPVVLDANKESKKKIAKELRAKMKDAKINKDTRVITLYKKEGYKWNNKVTAEYDYDNDIALFKYEDVDDLGNSRFVNYVGVNNFYERKGKQQYFTGDEFSFRAVIGYNDDIRTNVKDKMKILNDYFTIDRIIYNATDVGKTSYGYFINNIKAEMPFEAKMNKAYEVIEGDYCMIDDGGDSVKVTATLTNPAISLKPFKDRLDVNEYMRK